MTKEEKSADPGGGSGAPRFTFAPDEAPPSGLLLFPIRRPRSAVVLTLVLSVLSLLSVLRIRPDTSLEGLFPRGDRSALALSRVLKDFSVAEELLLLVSIPDSPAAAATTTTTTLPSSSPTSANLVAFAERFERSVKGDPEASKLAENVIYRIEPQTQEYFTKVVAPNGLFYLDDSAFAAAKQRLTKDGMAEQVRLDEAMVATPGPAGGLVKELLRDPLRLRDFLLDRVAKAQGTFKTQGGDALVSTDGKALLIRLPGRGPVSDMDFTKAFVGKMHQLADAANTDHLKLDFSGAYAIAAESERNIRSDATSSTFTSMLYLTLLFCVMYRGPVKLFILAFTPVALGNLLGFGLYATWSTALTPMTAVIGAMLAEMGINYSIHYLTLYDAAHAGGHTAKHAAAAATREIALPLLAAYCTSIVGFFAVGFSSLQVLREFAVLGSFALAGAVVATLLLLPAILVLLEGWRHRAKRARGAFPVIAAAIAENHTPSPGTPGGGGGEGACASESQGPAPHHAESTLTPTLSRSTGSGSEEADDAPKARLRFAFTPLLTKLVAAYRPLSILFWLTSIACLAVLAWPGERIGLETDLTIMHPRPNPPLDTQAAIAKRFGSAPGSLIVFLEAKDAHDLVCLAHDVERRLDTPAAHDAGVSGTVGLATFLPDPRLADARKSAFPPAEVEKVIADFNAVIEGSSFNPSSKAMRDYETFLRTLLSQPAPPTAADLLRYDRLATAVLPRDAVRHGPSAQPTESIMIVSLNKALGERADRTASVNAIRGALSDLPGATLAGIDVVAHDVEGTIHRDLPLILGVGCGAVVLYLLVHFRSVRAMYHVVLPTAFSLAVLLAVMRLAGQKLNMINLISAPLLIGINIDYGIFLVSLARAAHERRAPAKELIAEIGTSCHAVIVCAMTTLLGFGSLIFTSIPAVRSLGIAVSVGVTSCLVSTLFYLAPLLVRGVERNGRTGPA